MRKLGAPGIDLQAGVAGIAVESPQTEDVQRRDESDLGIARQRIAERHRPVRRQFGDETLGQRLDAVLLVAGLGLRTRIVADPDDDLIGPGTRRRARHRHHAGLAFGRDLVLAPDVAALDPHLPSLLRVTKAPARAISPGS